MQTLPLTLLCVFYLFYVIKIFKCEFHKNNHTHAGFMLLSPPYTSQFYPQ